MKQTGLSANSKKSASAPPALAKTSGTNIFFRRKKAFTAGIGLVLSALLFALASVTGAAAPLGTAFTYHGQLTDSGQPANGSYDLKFTLYDADTGTGLVAGPLTNTAVVLSNGLFAVLLDFGDVFSGSARWLEIGARTNGTSANFTILSPRQQLTPTPYARYAPSTGEAEVAKTVRDGAITDVKIAAQAVKSVHLAPGAVTSDKIAAESVDLAKLNTSSVDTRYVKKAGDTMTGLLALPADGLQAGGNQLVLAGGNVGIGTATPAVALDVNGEGRMWSLSVPNTWGSVGMNATWDGGGFTWRRLANGYASLMQQSGSDGGLNWSVADTGAAGAPISWGFPLQLTRGGDVVVDWVGANTNGTLSGGLRFGWSGSGEGIASKRSDGGNQWGLDLYTASQPRLSIANNGNVGIGTTNPAAKLDVAGTVKADSFLGSGAGLTGITGVALTDGSITGVKLAPGAVDLTALNTASVDTRYVKKAGDTMTGALNLPVNGLVAGGNQLVLSAGNVGIGEANPTDTLVIGGGGNIVLKSSGAIPDDPGDIIFRTSTGTQKARIYATPEAGLSKLHLSAGDSNARHLTVDTNGYVGIGTDNPTTKLDVVGTLRADAIAGRGAQPLEFLANGARALRLECVTGTPNVIGGYGGNYAGSNVVGATIAGGGSAGSFPFSLRNRVGGSYGSVLGGRDNIAGGYAATVAGGEGNQAGGKYSFAAGYYAAAFHDGSFVWADSTGGGMSSTSSNQFIIGASGGVGINTATPQAALDVNGSIRAVGGVTAQTVTITSDRAAKQDFAPVDAKDILERVASVPIQTWAFKNQPSTKHIGPVAQDFYAAFGVGTDDKHIATVDADGAALAAIQGLYQLVKERDSEIGALKRRLAALESALARPAMAPAAATPTRAPEHY